MNPPLPRTGERWLRALQAVGENPALAAIRAGMVALGPRRGNQSLRCP